MRRELRRAVFDRRRGRWFGGRFGRRRSRRFGPRRRLFGARRGRRAGRECGCRVRFRRRRRAVPPPGLAPTPRLALAPPPRPLRTRAAPTLSALPPGLWRLCSAIPNKGAIHGVALRSRAVPRRLGRLAPGMRAKGTPSSPWQADVPLERRRRRRSQQARQQRRRADRRDDPAAELGQPRPPNPQRPHPDPSPGGGPTLPPSAAQAAVFRRSSSMSASWSSTQSPGLREKMISRRPSDQRRLVSGSRVSAR